MARGLVMPQPPWASRAWHTMSFSGANDLWLEWYAKGHYDAHRTEYFGSRFRPCSTWASDQRAWRMGFADAIHDLPGIPVTT